MNSWTEYLQPVVLLLAVFLSVLFFAGVMTESGALLLGIAIFCAAGFAVGLVTLAVCRWKLRHAEYDLRAIVADIIAARPVRD